MLMTEKDARTRWCPMARQPRFDLEVTALTCNCMATRCPMWRWDEVHTINLRRKFYQATGEDAAAVRQPPRPTQVPHSWEWCPRDEEQGEWAGWLEPEAEMLARRVGYCGLAGMPVGIAKEVEEHGR